MKWISIFMIIVFISCDKSNKSESEAIDSVPIADTVTLEKDIAVPPAPAKEYSNERFREVTVEKISPNMFRVKGEGQIFEANFNWVVEDGHNELKKGYEMTNAGAPEWGRFDFSFDVTKENENSTLTLILFEVSAEDGSRQHELPIPLPN